MGRSPKFCDYSLSSNTKDGLEFAVKAVGTDPLRPAIEQSQQRSAHLSHTIQASIPNACCSSVPFPSNSELCPYLRLSPGICGHLFLLDILFGSWRGGDNG